MAELKPCPCCGGTAKMCYMEYNCTEDALYWVKCQKCGLQTRTYHIYGYTKEDVIRDWNRRYDVDVDDGRQEDKQ